MEARGGANYWAHERTALGCGAKLNALRYAKSFVKSNKTDYNDAGAIAATVQRPMKSHEQQDIQTLHRQRARIKKARTAL